MKHKIVTERLENVKQIEQCAEMYPGAYNDEPWNDNWTTETATALLTNYYNTPGFMGWIAKQDDIIIGCAIGNIEPYYTGNIFILKEIFVAVNAHRAGAGSSLLAIMKEELKKLNIKMIILSTQRPIFYFYEKSGFQEMKSVGTMIHFISESN